MPEERDHGRRRFLHTTAMALAVARFGMTDTAKANAGESRPARRARARDGVAHLATGVGSQEGLK